MRLSSKFFYCSALLLGAAELLSRMVFFSPLANTVATAIIAALVLTATLYRLEWGVLAVIAELMIGGKGYLFSFPIGHGQISLRMILFLIVISVWMSRWLLSGLQHTRWQQELLRHTLPATFAVIVALGVGQGLLRYSSSQVFFDANAWLFFLLLPVFLVTLNKPKHFERVIQLGIAATFVISIKTLLLLYWFGHADVTSLTATYRWIRDSGVGEITHVSGTLFRIFMQSHIYVLITLLIVLALLFSRTLRQTRSLVIAGATLYFGGLTLIASQSRSLWIGGSIGILFLIGYAIRRYALGFGRLVILAALLIVVIQSQLTFISFASGAYGVNIINRRLSGITQESASSSRQYQLKPLIFAISEHLWFGSGFGRTVTYTSMDPRVRREHPDGRYTTTAFEWGYLDTALKIGVVGLAFYLTWLLMIAKRCLPKKNSPDSWEGLSLGLICGLIGVAATNMFTPYLNHPLGIGYVLICYTAALSIQSTRLDRVSPQY